MERVEASAAIASVLIAVYAIEAGLPVETVVNRLNTVPELKNSPIIEEITHETTKLAY